MSKKDAEILEKIEEMLSPKPLMKIGVLKIAQSLKCGPRETDLFKEDQYEMTLYSNNVILIRHKDKGDVTFTSLANAQWWKTEK